MNDNLLSDSNDECFNVELWGSFNNEADMNDTADVEEFIWSRSYENFIRHGNIQRKFVPLKSQDIKNIRKDFDNINSILSNNQNFTILELNILQDEAKYLENILLDICPHLIFEAEYLEENSTYNCSICKLPYLKTIMKSNSVTLL